MTLTTIGAGLGASAGMVAETSYGVVKTSPTWTFFEPTSITPKKIKTPKQSSGLAAGRYVDLAQRRVITEQAATLSLPLEVMQSGGFTALLNLLSSSYAAGAAGAQSAGAGIYVGGARASTVAGAYAYTHTFRNSIAGRSCAWQIGLPTIDGTLRQYDLLGCKPTSFAFDCKGGEILTCATEWDSRVMEDPLITTAYQGYPNGATQTPYTQATPSYAVQSPFHFAQASIAVGTNIAGAASIDGLTQFNLKIERKLNVGRQYYGNAGLKDEPITNDVVALTGTLTSDYLNKATFADAFYSDTPQTVIVTFSAGAPSGTVNAIQFVMNNVYLNDTSPAAANKDIISTAFPFQVLYDLTNEPLTIIIQTTDATG